MVLRREGDRVIADMVEDDDLRAVVCSGCWCLEVYRLSELLTAEGEWREQMRGGEWREVLGREMEGKTASDRGLAADRWVDAVMKLVKGWGEEGGRLGRYSREAVALGTFVLVGGNSGVGMWLGQVKEIEGSGQWSDVATVAAWV